RFPRLSHQSAKNNNYEMSDFWLFDGSYFRLKNVTIGYNLPESLLSRINMKGARIYMSGTDLFALSDYPKGYDPEALNNSYLSSTYSLGLNIKFYMTMKNIFKKPYVIGLFFTAMLFSCAELDLVPPSEGSNENWYSDQTEIEMSLNDLYRTYV